MQDSEEEEEDLLSGFVRLQTVVGTSLKALALIWIVWIVQVFKFRVIALTPTRRRTASSTLKVAAWPEQRVEYIKTRTCTARIVVLTPARCLLAEADTTARDNCAVAWRVRCESPSGT